MTLYHTTSNALGKASGDQLSCRLMGCSNVDHDFNHAGNKRSSEDSSYLSLRSVDEAAQITFERITQPDDTLHFFYKFPPV